MDRKLLIVAVAASVACWKGEASVGTCNADTDCGANSTCNTSQHVCEYACPKLCAANEVCLGGACVAQGPEVKQVTAPATWSKRSQPVTVTAVVDGSSGPGDFRQPGLELSKNDPITLGLRDWRKWM